MKDFKYRSVIGLTLLYTATILNWNWAWGVMFMVWVIPDLFSGTTYFMEPIHRKTNPFIYWAAVLLWLFSGTYILMDSLTPEKLPVGWSSQSYVPAVSKGDVKVLSSVESVNDTLFYQPIVSDGFTVMGVSVSVNYTDSSVLNREIKQLWAELEKIQVPQNILNNKSIYGVYSNYDHYQKGWCTITLGYRIANEKSSPKTLSRVTVAASKYAGFRMEQDYANQLIDTWNHIAFSKINRSKINDVEIYQFDESGMQITGISLWISMPTSVGDLKALNTATPKTMVETKVEVIPESKQVEVIHHPSSFLEKKAVISSVEKLPDSLHQQFAVIGIQERLNFTNGNTLKTQLDKLWSDFAEKKSIRTVKGVSNYSEVFVIYSEYEKSDVLVTIGFKVNASDKNNLDKLNKKGLHQVVIKTNTYYQVPPTEWESVFNKLPSRSKSSSDFEVYQFDKSNNITHSNLWVATK